MGENSGRWQGRTWGWCVCVCVLRGGGGGVTAGMLRRSEPNYCVPPAGDGVGVCSAKCVCRRGEVTTWTSSICGYVLRACLCLSVGVFSCTVRPTSSVMESRDDVASSYSRMGGFFSTARAMATRCFSPPKTKKNKQTKCHK